MKNYLRVRISKHGTSSKFKIEKKLFNEFDISTKSAIRTTDERTTLTTLNVDVDNDWRVVDVDVVGDLTSLTFVDHRSGLKKIKEL